MHCAQRGAGPVISYRGRGLLREPVTRPGSGKAGPGGVRQERVVVRWRAGECFPASDLAADVLDPWLVTAPECGAPECGAITLSSGEAEGTGVSHWCVFPRRRLFSRTRGISCCNWQGNSCPPLARGPRLWLPKATYKTSKAVIVGRATFIGHIVKRDFSFQAGFPETGEEKTCPTSRS